MSFAAVLQRLETLENPYPGLRPFDTSEAHLFFGRDQQISELIGRLERNRFVAVVGVSGSGKSSLVCAGLIAALQHGRVTDSSARWRIVVCRPAGAPFACLADKLSEAGLDPGSLQRSSYGLIQVAQGLPPDETLLVVIDQFEELFRYKDLEAVTEQSRHDHKRAAAEAYEFVQVLLTASRHQPPVYVVITMRSDYLGDCAEFRDLPEALNECQYLIPRLTRDQRRLAIECPLGATPISPALVQRMLNDAGDEPDQLPILQHALMRTWSQWHKSDPGQKRKIELQDYEVVGGFQHALDQHADELLKNVPSNIAATVFKRLTARGRNQRERRDPARLAELWELCAANTQEKRDEVTAVIDHFRQREATFLLPRGRNLAPDNYIDIAHESLIRQWKILRDQWLQEETRSASTLLDLVARSRNWKLRSGELLSGLDLTDALEWDGHRNPTDAWARHYADESALIDVLEFIKASTSEKKKREWRKRRNFWLAIGACVLFALLAVAVGVERYRRELALAGESRAEHARTEAQEQRAIAEDARKEAERLWTMAEDARKEAEIQRTMAEDAQRHADQQRERAERLSEVVLGSLISKVTGLSDDLALALAKAPLGSDPRYMDMSIRVQAKLKEHILLSLSTQPLLYRNIRSVSPLLVYACIPPSNDVSVMSDGTSLTPNPKGDLYWDSHDPVLRRGMASKVQTIACLKKELTRIKELLASESSLAQYSSFYDPSNVGRILSEANDEFGDRLLMSLFFLESTTVHELFQATRRIASLRTMESVSVGAVNDNLYMFRASLVQAARNQKALAIEQLWPGLMGDWFESAGPDLNPATKALLAEAAHALAGS